MAHEASGGWSRQEMAGAEAGWLQGLRARSDEKSRERETAEGEGSPSFLQFPVHLGPPGGELKEPGENTGPWGRC